MPLHRAACDGRLDVVTALIAHGAQTDATNHLVGDSWLGSCSKCANCFSACAADGTYVLCLTVHREDLQTPVPYLSAIPSDQSSLTAM